MRAADLSLYLMYIVSEELGLDIEGCRHNKAVAVVLGETANSIGFGVLRAIFLTFVFKACRGDEGARV